MKASFRHRALNLGLRLVGLLSKLGVTLVIARHLPVHEVGLFGLIAGFAAFAAILLGLEFYTYANREMASSPLNERRGVLIAQLRLYGLMYAILIVAGLIVGVSDLAPWQLVAWCVAIAIFEHLGFETYRILVTMNDQLVASSLLLVRSGLWGLVCIILFLLWPAARQLDLVLAAWLCCVAAAALLGAIRISRFAERPMRPRPGRNHIKLGLRTARLFFIGTVASTALITLDRFLVAGLVTLAAAGAYSVYISIAGALRSLIDASVLAYTLPQMLASGRSGDRVQLRNLWVRASKEAALISVVLSIFALVGAWVVAPLLFSPIYLEFFGFLPLGLIAAGLLSLSNAGQQVLYALRADRAIVLANVVGLVVFLCTAFLLASTTFLAVGVALCCGAFSLLLLKSLAVHNALRTTP